MAYEKLMINDDDDIIDDDELYLRPLGDMNTI